MLARLDDVSGDEGVGEGGGGVAGVLLPVVVAFEADDVADAANRHYGVLLAHLLGRQIHASRLHLYRFDAARPLLPLLHNDITTHQAIAGRDGAGEEFRGTLPTLPLAKMP